MRLKLLLMFILGTAIGLLASLLILPVSGAAALPVKEFNVVGQIKVQTTDPATFTILLSGSDAAIHKLSSLAPQLRHQIEGIVNQSFVHGLRGVMVLSIVLSALSVPPALWGRTRHVRGGEHPVAHPMWAGLWRRAHVPRPEP